MENSRIRATNMGSVETNILLTGSFIQFCCMLTSHTSFSLPANAIFFRPQPTAVQPTDTPPDMHQHIKRIRPETILGGQLFANKQNSKMKMQRYGIWLYSLWEKPKVFAQHADCMEENMHTCSEYKTHIQMDDIYIYIYVKNTLSNVN